MKFTKNIRLRERQFLASLGIAVVYSRILESVGAFAPTLPKIYPLTKGNPREAVFGLVVNPAAAIFDGGES